MTAVIDIASPTELTPPAGWCAASLLLLLKRESPAGTDLVIAFDLAARDAFSRIRCPLCDWQPEDTSRWCCTRVDAPERFLGGCGTVWNTFSTRGRCPGCQHQWLWTKCLRCNGWSLHDDWYEEREDRH